jgi:alginate O-acetyltransferase complex protein AlgI
MPFASIHFLFIFFPIVLLLFYILPYRKWRNIVLVLASLFFLGWADPTHLPIIVASVLINYVYGFLIGLFQDKNETFASRIHMWIAVLINLLILCLYKYLGFIDENIQALIQIPLNIKAQILPLGISYFTFSGISYILDVYNGVEKAEKNVFRFSAYMIMFPKLLQGPITRLGQVKNELLNPHFITEEVMQGVRRFVVGLAKKVILADSLAIVANKVFDADLFRISAGVAWYGLIAYTLQIYFDFSGYTDMAIGLGRIFGFKLPENFNYPYISLSITDFWRRWHMSLTNWFRTYLFIPLEFMRKKEKGFRQQSNILIVFLLTGLWHGASWNFVIWGGYFGLILAIEASGFGKFLKKSPRFMQHIYSLALVMLGWIFFRLTSIQNWGLFIRALFGANGWTGASTLRTLNILFYIPIVILALLFCLPLVSKMENKILIKFGFMRVFVDIVYLGLFVLAISYLLSNGFTSFLYAQF